MASAAERVAPWVAGLVLAVPVLVAHYPPMADLPLHEAVVGLLRHWGDPSFVPPHVYALNLGHPNQLFYFLILALAYVLPTTAAAKLVVAGTILLLPVSVARLADHLGVTRWTAVLVAPLGLGWMFFWGLLANMQGFEAYFFALPALDRFCQKPTWRGLFGACAWVVLLHFTHDLMALVAGGTIIVFSACKPGRWRGTLVRLVPAALIVIIVFAARALMLEIYDPGRRSLPDFVWAGLGHKILGIPSALFGSYEWWVRVLIFVACAVPTALFAIEAFRSNRRERRSWRERLYERRFDLLAASLAFSYFVAPASMKSTTHVYERFMPLAWALLTVSVGPKAGLERPWRLPRLLACVVPFVPLLTSWPPFVESSAVYRDLDACIQHMDGGSTYVVLELGPFRDYEMYRPVTGVGHIVAALGGRGLSDFSHSPASPVFKKIQWASEVARVGGDSYRFLPAYDLTRFRYAILHSTDATIMTVGALAMEPDARVIFQQGEWTVMESTHAQVPIDAPDEPLPPHHGKSLAVRARAVADAIRGMPGAEPPSP